MDIQRPDLLQKKRRRQAIMAGVALSLVALAAWGLSRLEPAAPSVDRASVWLDTVREGEMLREVRGPGLLVPRELRWIAAETQARVVRIVLRPGAVVEPDSVILVLDNPEVEDQLLAAEAAFRAAEADLAARGMELESQLLDRRANLAAVEAEQEGARLQAEAERELHERGIISALQFRRSELQARQLGVRLDIERQRITTFERTIAAQLDADRARLKQLGNTLALRRRQAEGLEVRAGIAGVLQQVAVEEGQQVPAGSNLARVGRPDQLIAELRVPETLAKEISPGQQARIDVRNGVVPGRVIRIDPAVREGAVQVDVEFAGELPPGARPDQSVDGTIEIERLDKVVHVGRPAFGQPNSATTLFRVDPVTGIATRVPVELGRASVSVIEVVRGLAPGDQVVLSDTGAYDEHERIRLR